MDKSLPFYRDVLGLTHVRTEESPDHVRASLSDDYVNLTLLKSEGPTESYLPSRPDGEIGLGHIGFLVDDTSAIRDRLKEAGTEFATLAPADFFKVRDPDGMIVDIAAVSRGWW